MKRLIKKLTLLLLAILVIGVPLLYLTILNSKEVKAAWFDDNWAYRKAITVTVVSNSSDLSNLQTLITVDTTGITSKLQSSCQDLRFTNVSGKTLPYYIDSCTNNSATNKIWVLADLVPKNTTTYTMYMYYGNPSAPAGSDSTSTNFNLLKGLVGYWTMNGTASPAVDSSVSGNSGTWIGNAASGTGQYGNGISLDGTGDYVSIGAVGTYNLGAGNFSLCSWFKTSGTEEDIISNGVGADGNYLLMSYLGKLRGHIWYSGNTNVIDSNATVNDNNWHHGCEVVDSTTIKLYIDGALDKSQALVGSKTGVTGTTIIGSRTAVSAGNNFIGTIDDTRVYNRALSASEITQLYANPGAITTTATATSQPSPTTFATEETTPGPIAYWKFDEGTGTTANDSTRQGNNGTLQGTTKPTWQTEDQCMTGKCLYFDGSSSYVLINNTSSLNSNTGAISVSTWVKPIDVSGNKVFVSRQDGSSNWTLWLSGANPKWRLYTGGTNSGVDLSCTNIPLTANTWYHVLGTWDGSTSKIFVNGLQCASQSVTGTLATGANIRIGNDSGTTWMEGFIDDVKVYPFARSAAQVATDYNSRGAVTGSSANLGNLTVNVGVGNSGPIAYYKFDEGTGLTANNSGNGGSALNGTISNGIWSQSGKFGKALIFASNTSVTTTITDPGYSNTISLWINPATSIASKTLFTASKLTTDSSSRPTYGNCTGTALSLSSWTHIVAVSDGSGSCKIYQNGVQIASSTTGVTFGTSVNIGASSFTGSIDEPKIYNFALTASQVLLDMNHGQAQLLGALSNSTSYAPQATNQIYCVPGDSTSCAAPVGEWTFEEGTGTAVNDTSGNGNTGSWNGTGASHWTQGKYGSAGKFNGSDDYVSVADANSLDITGNLTISAWVKWTGNPNNDFPQIVGKINGANTAANYLLGFYLSTREVYFDHNNGTGFDTQRSGLLVKNNDWSFVTVTVSGNTVTFYVDGASATTTKSKAFAADANPFEIGRLNVTGGSRYFNGQMDQVRIFNYARSAAQVAWDYNRGAPVARWKMDECQGTITHDSSPNGYTGTLNGETNPGTCTDGTGTTAWSKGANGKYNASLNFDGTDDYIETNNAIVGTTDPVTISAWVYYSGSAGSQADILGRGVDGSGAGWSLWLYKTASNNWQFSVVATGGGAAEYDVAGASSITANTWYHVVGIWSPGVNIKLYVNGVLENTTTVPKTNLRTSTVGVQLGKFNGGTPTWNGRMDDVQIYNYALTATQIQALYNGNSAVRFGPSTGTP